MRSDESIRTDASTVHRQSGEASEPSLSEPPVSASAAEEMAEAQTVIRGSSRAPADSPRPDRTPVAVTRVLLGQRLNHFLLEDLIGGGGMGAVFRARDEQLDRTVAIKVIPFVGDDADLKRRFRNEAQSAAKLDHPCIARVFEVGNQDDWHYIVFEYVRGINIRDKVARDGVFSIDDAVYTTCQIGEAIQHAADRGIVHRDIKPSNILIGEGDQIKLVDMGLARSDNLEVSEDMTASGVTLGTFDYISPEQARDPREADARSDIYSLGCTLYYMLTGRPPFPGGTMLQKLLSHGNSPPPDARLLRSEVSDDLMAVIRKMLAKLPEDRYQNAADLIADLREIANREGLQRTQAVAVPVLAEPSLALVWLRTHAPWMIAAVLLGGSAAWLQWSSRGSREAFRIDVPEVETTVARSAAASGTAGPAETPPAPVEESAAGPEAAGEPVGSASSEAGGEISATGDDPATDPPSGPERMVPTPDQQADVDDGTATGDADAATPSTGTAAAGDTFNPESAGGDGSGGDGASDAIETIRVVGTDGPIGASDAGAGVAVTRTLTEALELARQRGTRRIEIGVPVLKSGPVVLRQDDISITSSVGRSTIVLESEDLLSMQRSKMFTVGSNRVRFRDLNFVWRVPVGEVDGGALFVIHPNRLVSMAGCTVTIENSSRRDEVYAFEVLTDPQSDAASAFAGSAAGEGADLPLVAINLNDVVVRGEITMLHMDYAAELQLGWKNGLLAVSRRMIGTAGALARPSATSGSIQLSLERLTACAPLGFVRMRLGPSGAYPVPIDRNAVASVFAVDTDAPYFEVTGLASLDREPPLLTLRGESNAYDATKELENPLYRRSAGSDNRRVTLLSAFSPESTRPDWWTERSPHWAVRWSRTEVPEQIPASQLTPADFRQDGLPLRGFDEQSLPPLPPPSATRTAGPATGGPEIDLNLPPIPSEP